MKSGAGGRGGERQERRVDGIAGHYSETRICSFVSSLCMRRGVCASFYRLKSRLRITVQMIFFRVRTRNPLAHAAPSRTPSSSSRAPSAHTRTYADRIFSFLREPRPRLSPLLFCQPLSLFLVDGAAIVRGPPTLSLLPPRTTQKEFKTGPAVALRDDAATS